MKKYAVIGNPIEHSLSPNIHEQFAWQFGLDLQYEKLLVPPGQFQQQLSSLAKTHSGINITLPLKEEAFHACDQLTQHAKAAGAVNTIHFQSDGTILGDNTDGRGLLNDLAHKNVPIQNQNILIIGAGGAVRGILPVLLEQRPKSIVVANRNIDRAQSLQKQFNINICKLADILDQEYDLVIYAIALNNELNIPTIKAKTYYDLNYLPIKTNMPITYNGLGMLVEQAALSFELWTGHKPDTASCLSSLQKQVSGHPKL